MLNWVKVRAECTIHSVFKKLRCEIEADVSNRNGYLTESQIKNGVTFEVEDKDDGFVVHRKGIDGSVGFAIFGSHIKAIGSAAAVDATIGMNDNGRCMLRMKESERIVELENWQFRKKALESLFFPDASLLA